MSAQESGVGVGGTEFSHYEYPGLYQTQDFHHCGLTPDDDVQNFNDRAQVHTCELVNLAEYVESVTSF